MQNRSRDFSEKLIGAMLRAALVVAAVLFVWGNSLAAQSAQTASPIEEGSMVVYRDVPTRPAQATGTGERLTVDMAPNEAFTTGLDLGITELDDAQAALITSSSLRQLHRLLQTGTAGNATSALTDGNLGHSDMPSLDIANTVGSGSLISGSISAGVAPASNIVGGALNTALGTSGGGR